MIKTDKIRALEQRVAELEAVPSLRWVTALTRPPQHCSASSSAMAGTSIKPSA